MTIIGNDTVELRHFFPLPYSRTPLSALFTFFFFFFILFNPDGRLSFPLNPTLPPPSPPVFLPKRLRTSRHLGTLNPHTFQTGQSSLPFWRQKRAKADLTQYPRISRASIPQLRNREFMQALPPFSAFLKGRKKKKSVNNSKL